AIFKLSDFPKGLGAVIRRSMLKHLKMERSDGETSLRSGLASVAARELSDESLDAVLALLEDELQRPDRCWSIQELWNFEQPKAAEALRKLLTHPDGWVRFMAASGLSRRRDLAAVPVLVETSKNPTSEERTYALHRLSDYWDDPRAVAAIDQAIKDTDARVRQSAGWAKQSVERSRTNAAIRAKESDKTPDGAGRDK
ncbi:MAG: HEAT repeat domain-containing protein, partial [Tepidisphaeraceae bacterium]